LDGRRRINLTHYQPGVMLDQLARDLVEEGSAGMGNLSVFAPKPSDRLGVVAGAALRPRPRHRHRWVDPLRGERGGDEPER
jgi:hypothetical protein